MTASSRWRRLSRLSLVSPLLVSFSFVPSLVLGGPSTAMANRANRSLLFGPGGGAGGASSSVVGGGGGGDGGAPSAAAAADAEALIADNDRSIDALHGRSGAIKAVGAGGRRGRGWVRVRGTSRARPRGLLGTPCCLFVFLCFSRALWLYRGGMPSASEANPALLCVCVCVCVLWPGGCLLPCVPLPFPPSPAPIFFLGGYLYSLGPCGTRAQMALQIDDDVTSQNAFLDAAVAGRMASTAGALGGALDQLRLLTDDGRGGCRRSTLLVAGGVGGLTALYLLLRMMF